MNRQPSFLIQGHFSDTASLNEEKYKKDLAALQYSPQYLTTLYKFVMQDH